jgi:hypothetical protein
MVQESDQNIQTRRRWPIRMAVAAALIGLVISSIDYVIFQNRESQISKVVQQSGGKSSSIGGWPIGVEHFVVLSRPLTNSELQELAAANSIHRSGRHAVRVHFRNCDLSEGRLAEIRSILQPIPVTADDGNK